MRSFHILRPLAGLVTVGILIFAFNIPAHALQFECPLAVENPVHEAQSFTCLLPADILQITQVRLAISGEFTETIWLCNLETPDAFGGPGALTFVVGATGILSLPSSNVDWTAPVGAFDLEIVVPPPEGNDWGFLVGSGEALIVIDEYTPDGWSCYDRCPHGCTNVSGFESLVSARLIIDYELEVSAPEQSWGTLKASW